MIIAGKYENRIIFRCCEEGKWQIGDNVGHSFCVPCSHTGFSCHTNGIPVDQLEEVTNKIIINEAKEQERIEIKRSKEASIRLFNKI